jgi:hypothetical protein
MQMRKISQPVPEVHGESVSQPVPSAQSPGRDHISFHEDVNNPRAAVTGFDQGHHSDEDNTDLGKLRRRINRHNFLTKQNVGRNAQFYGLTNEERELIGGIEYRALNLLSIIVPMYFICWQVFGCIALGA